MTTTPATIAPGTSEVADVTRSQNILEKQSTAAPAIKLKYWTVQEYHRMAELGILDASERTELIAGQITLMVAKGISHVLTLRILAGEMEALLVNHPVFVSTQDPVCINNSSEPEPDLAIVRGTAFDYVDQHPQTKDICLIVEVADSTLKYDCEVKDKIYAKANITDYWVIDIPHRQVHIFRDPMSTGYTSHLILTEPQTVSPLAFPSIKLSISSILPPR
jgi:Uma2 family endonuclease